MKRIKPFSYSDMISSSMSPIEIQYLTKLIKTDMAVSPETRNQLIAKLESLKPTDDLPLSSQYVKNNGSCNAGEFYFMYDSIQNTIEVVDNENGEYALQNINVSAIDDIIEDCFSIESVDAFLNHVRFCSICGRPMDRGYTDEDSWICSDSEFALMMDETYGINNWRIALKEEKEKYECEFMYYEKGFWIPSTWYCTEWYEEGDR